MRNSIKQLAINLYSNRLAIFLSFITFLVFFYKLFLPNYWVFSSDSRIMHLPVRQYLHDAIFVNGSFPFWTEKAYGGYPIFKNPEFQYLNPANVFSIIIFGPTISYKILLFLSYFVGSYSLWLFMKRRGLSLPGYFCANLIYYFSFFLINHQLHFNIILTAYLFPTVLLLQDILLEKMNTRNLIYLSLLLGYLLYCGHSQTTFLIYVSSILYFLISIKSKKEIKRILTLIFFVFILVFFITLPLNVATYEVAKDTIRSVDPFISYTEGTYYPPLFSNTIIPYLYKNFDHFTGRDLLNKYYTYTETYTYIGITSFIIAFFGLIFTKRNRLSYFSYALILLFVFFSSVGLFPIFKYVPVITLFRHWERSVFLANAGVGLLVANFIKNYEFKSLKYVLNKKVILLILIPFLYFLLLIYVSHDSEVYQVAAKHSALLPDIHKVWKVVASLSLVSILFMSIKRTRNLSILMICFLVLVDLRYYGDNAINTRIQYTSLPISIVNIDGFDNKRIIDIKSNLDGMQYLNANYYSLFGYTQLINKSYRDTLKMYGYSGNITNPNDSTVFDNELKQYFDVQAIVTSTGIIETDYLNDRYIYLQNSEQHKVIKTLNNDTELLTSIRCDKGWNVTLNGEPVQISCAHNNLFVQVTTRGIAGDLIDFKYIPKTFYITNLFSFISAIAILRYFKRLPI